MLPKRNKKNRCLCQCDCGNIKDVDYWSLLNGDSKSCGKCDLVPWNSCVDHTGKQFGKLLAVERLPHYKGNKTYYRCICDCGNEKIISSSNLVCGCGLSCGCDNKRGLNRRINHVGEKYNKLTILELYYNYNNKGTTYAKCLCDCGNEKIICLKSVLSGKSQSCGCYERECRYLRKHFVDITGQKFGKLTALEPVGRNKEGNTLWRCKCDCGNEHIVQYSSLHNGNCRSCGCNRTSQYEEQVQHILDELNIAYETQYTFHDCRNVLPLPFDFHFIHLNQEWCIEVQGQQHYAPVKGWGGEETFEKVQKRDQIKYNYCKDNNINLIILPYTLNKEEMKQSIINSFPP